MELALANTTLAKLMPFLKHIRGQPKCALRFKFILTLRNGSGLLFLQTVKIDGHSMPIIDDFELHCHSRPWQIEGFRLHCTRFLTHHMCNMGKETAACSFRDNC